MKPWLYIEVLNSALHVEEHYVSPEYGGNASYSTLHSDSKYMLHTLYVHSIQINGGGLMSGERFVGVLSSPSTPI